MTPPQLLSRVAWPVLLAGGVVLGAWLLIRTNPTTSKSEKSSTPAVVSKVVKEDELNTVVLTHEAEKRIGLTLGPVESKKVRRVRVYGGEAMVPIGHSIVVSAPLGGTLKAPNEGMLKVGSAMKAGQPVFHLSPLLSPDGQATLSAALADANGQVNTAKATFELAQIAMKRADQVLRDGAGSQRQVDEARAALDVARQTLDAATSRQTILKKVVGDVDGGTAAPITIESPEEGILRSVFALPGQAVPGGAVLFEVVNLSVIWVRVPVPVSDLDEIDPAGSAQVSKLSVAAEAGPALAKPIVAPPSANPLSATVDRFYELPNAENRLHPGQRLGVAVPLTSASEGLTVPWSAVLFDVHGGTWVYVETTPRTYTRKRVVVKFTAGDNAVLDSGPDKGARVVVQGAHQLFGAETGFVK